MYFLFRRFPVKTSTVNKNLHLLSMMSNRILYFSVINTVWINMKHFLPSTCTVYTIVAILCVKQNVLLTNFMLIANFLNKFYLLPALITLYKNRKCLNKTGAQEKRTNKFNQNQRKKEQNLLIFFFAIVRPPNLIFSCNNWNICRKYKKKKKKKN